MNHDLLRLGPVVGPVVGGHPDRARPNPAPRSGRSGQAGCRHVEVEDLHRGSARGPGEACRPGRRECLQEYVPDGLPESRMGGRPARRREAASPPRSRRPPRRAGRKWRGASSTRMAPVVPRATPADRARSTAGSTPTATTARSAVKRSLPAVTSARVVVGRNGLDRRAGAQVHPVSPQGGGDDRADFRIEEAGEGEGGRLQERDLDPPEGAKGFRELAPDEAGTDDHHPGDLPSCQRRVKRGEVLRGVKRRDAGMAGLARETAGAGPGGQDEVVPIEILARRSRSLANEPMGADVDGGGPAARENPDPFYGGEVRRVAESAVARRPERLPRRRRRPRGRTEGRRPPPRRVPAPRRR